MSFVSYEYLGLEGYDPKTNEFSLKYKYKIIDSEWEAVAVLAAFRGGVVVGVVVIQEYSKRDLPVAANLIRAFQFASTKYGRSIQQIIDWNKQYNPQYKQYEEEVDRLLVLL